MTHILTSAEWVKRVTDTNAAERKRLRDVRTNLEKLIVEHLWSGKHVTLDNGDISPAPMKIRGEYLEHIPLLADELEQFGKQYGWKLWAVLEPEGPDRFYFRALK